MSFFLHLFLLLFFTLFSIDTVQSTPSYQNPLSTTAADNYPFLGITNGWITTDANHQINTLAKDGQLVALFNPASNSLLTDSKLLSSSDDGTLLTRLIWNEDGDEFIELLNLSERNSTYLALEGRFLRALRMSKSGLFIAALLSDGFLYQVEVTENGLMLKRLGNLPSVLASEWTIDDEGNLHWVSADGKGFSKKNGQINESFVVNNSLKIASAFPITSTNSQWLLQDEGQFLHLINGSDNSIAIGNPNAKINALLSFDWLLSYNANGSAYVFHPLLAKRSKQAVALQQLLGIAAHGIIGIDFDGKLTYLPISAFYQNLASNLAIHKRIAVEEITNDLAAANLSRQTLSSSTYSAQKEGYRQLAQFYLDKNLPFWTKGIPNSDFNFQLPSTLDKALVPFISAVQWENNRLSKEIMSKDVVRLSVIYSGDVQDQQVLNTIQIVSKDTQSIPIIQKILKANVVELWVNVPELAEKQQSWDLTIKDAKNAINLSIPVLQLEAQKVTQLSGIAQVENGLINVIQWNGRFLRVDDDFLELQISESTNPNKIIAQTSIQIEEDGQFQTNLPLPLANRLIVNSMYTLRIKRKNQPILDESFFIEPNYPYTLKIGKKSAAPLAVFTHPLLQDLPQKSYEAKNAIVLLIGNSDYKYAPKADYALRDVRLMHTYFTEVLGVPKKQVTVIENASLSDMIYYLGSSSQEGRLMDIPNRNEKKLMVYFSGHGMPSLDGKDGFLLPVDARLNRPDITAFQLSAFYEQLRILEMGETVVFLESCFSGRTGNGQSLLPNASASVGVQIKIPLLANDKVSIFTASDASELASWDKTNQSGLFTARLLEGFKHFAKERIPFTSEDLILWLENPSDGVYARARKWYSREQHPQMFANDSDRVLFKLTTD